MRLRWPVGCQKLLLSKADRPDPSTYRVYSNAWEWGSPFTPLAALGDMEKARGAGSPVVGGIAVAVVKFAGFALFDSRQRNCERHCSGFCLVVVGV
eukprot:2473871-Rhodomonas_salina.1